MSVAFVSEDGGLRGIKLAENPRHKGIILGVVFTLLQLLLYLLF
jgi:hypothetical protein